MVKVTRPGVVGVPERRPSGDNVRPFGSWPLSITKLYGAVPPVPVMVWL